MNLYQITYKSREVREVWATEIRFEREHVSFYTDRTMSIAVRSENVYSIELL